MTDKQIIIDDCIHLDEWKHCNICEKLIKTKDGANGKKREHLLTEEDLRCDFYPNCYYKQLKAKEQKCEDLRNKLNSNIERMNSQNEKLHNENKELKSYIKEDLVPHTQIYVGLINRIKQQMKTILMVSTNGKYRPVKNSTKEQCYQILGNIQELLKTNIITISIKE